MGIRPSYSLFLQVQAVTIVGPGNFSEPTTVIVSSDSSTGSTDMPSDSSSGSTDMPSDGCSCSTVLVVVLVHYVVPIP